MTPTQPSYMSPQVQVGGAPSQWNQQQPRQEASFFRGAPGRFDQLNTKTPQQQDITSYILGLIRNGIGNPEMQQQGFQPYAQAARQNWSENTLPSILERFTSLGKGAESSGALQGLLARGGADLESGLAQGASQYGQQHQNFLGSLLSQVMGPQFENVYTPRQASGAESLIPQLIQAGAQLGAASLSGGSSPISELMKLLQGGGSSASIGGAASDAAKRAAFSTRGGF